MRIAFFVDTFPVLSETFILNQITGLIDLGHDVRIFAASRPREKLMHTNVRSYHLLEKTVYINDKPSNKILRIIAGTAQFTKHAPLNPEIMHNAINFFKFGRESFSLTLLFRAAAVLNEGYFDIFYCHYAHNGELALKLTQIGFKAKVITMFHGYDLRRGLRDEGQSYRNLINNGDAFLSISNYTSDILKQWGIDPAKIIRHPIGVDIDECSLHSHERLTWKPIRVITVARLIPEKNLGLAITAVRKLVDEYGLKNFSYRIIGDGPLLAELKKHAKGLEKNISFGGAMTHNAVLEELNNADIFLLSSNEEVLPTSLMEAQGCALPVITTDVGAVREIVQDDVSGFVVPKGDLNSLTEKLAYLLIHSQVRRKMGEKGRSLIQQHYDIKELNSRLADIFRTVQKGSPLTELPPHNPPKSTSHIKHINTIKEQPVRFAKVKVIYPGLLLLSFLTALFTAVVTLLYKNWGEQLITDIYAQRSHYLLNIFISAQKTTPLSEYFEKARQVIFNLNGMGYAAAAAFLIGAFKNNNRKRFLFYSIFFSFAVAFYSQSSAFLYDYVINDGVRQNIWWMWKFIDPKLFSNDFLTNYAVSLQNIGIMGLYRLVSFFMDPLFFSKILPLILFPISSMFIYLISEEEGIKPEFSFLIASAFCVTPYYLLHTVGGHAYTFGFALLTSFIYFFIRQNFRACSLIMVLQSLFFPVILLLSAGLYGSSILLIQRKKWIRDTRKEKWAIFLTTLIICIGILMLKFVVLKNPEIGKPFTKAEIAKMTEFSDGGRREVYPVKPVWKEVLNFSSNSLFLFPMIKKSVLPPYIKEILIDKYFLMSVLFLMFILVMRKRFSPVTDVLIRSFLISIILYWIASIFMLRMDNPDRYLEYSIPLAALFIFTLPLSYLLQDRSSQHFRKFLFLLIFSLILLNINLSKDLALISAEKEKKLFQFLQMLPVDSLIAAPPEIADNIPVFAKRRVFINSELSLPLYDKYWYSVKTRTYDFFKAYYADNFKTVSDFSLKYRIDYLIFRKSDFKEPALRSNDFYFEPFNTYIKRLIEKKKGLNGFILPDIPVRYKIFEDENFVILNARRMAVIPFNEQ
jgi:colanic acid/amylovoran biosynthesis glycosyltransferase